MGDKAELAATIGGSVVAGIGAIATGVAAVKSARISADAKAHEVDEKTRVALAQMKSDLEVARLDTKNQLAVATLQTNAQLTMHKEEMVLEKDKLNFERDKLSFEKDKHKDDTKLAHAELDLKRRTELGYLDLDVQTEKDQHEESMARIESGTDDWSYFGYA